MIINGYENVNFHIFPIFIDNQEYIKPSFYNIY